MPKKREAELKPGKVCRGGISFGCRHEPHSIGKIEDVLCWKCKARLGCSACVQIAQERVCLRCHDWGSKAGLAAHGSMVDRRGLEVLSLT